MLALFIGFCVIFGFTKTKKTAGGRALVVKSLDERISHQPMAYLSPSAPPARPTSSTRRNFSKPPLVNNL